MLFSGRPRVAAAGSAISVTLEYSIACHLHVVDMVGTVMVGLPGAAQRLPADVPASA